MDPDLFETYRNLMEGAYIMACQSPDPSTKLGSIATDKDYYIVGMGYNHPSPGVEMTQAKWERPLKYEYMQHAEVAAILTAFRGGCLPAVLVCPWAACATCAMVIVGSGCKTLVRHKQIMEARKEGPWTETILVGDEIMQAGGVEVIDLDAPDVRVPD